MKHHLLYIIMCAALLSCTSSHLGKYVYLETWRNGYRLHVDRHCSNFNKNGEVIYIETSYLQDYQSFCPKCVTDEDAEKLKEIINTNGKIKKLYNQLIQDGYTLDDFTTFKDDLQHDTAFQHQIYDAQKADGYDMGGDFKAWQGRLMQSFKK